MLLEAIMTFTLIWVIFGTGTFAVQSPCHFSSSLSLSLLTFFPLLALDPEASNKHAPLAIGLVLVGDLIVGWLYTGKQTLPDETKRFAHQSDHK